MSYGSEFVLTLFTDDATLAAAAEAAGIDRVGLDLERLGKNERQGRLATWISDHVEADLGAVRAALTRSRLFTRCNPVHAGLGEEIERLLGAGVQVLMLPYFKRVDEAEAFLRLVDGRAHPVLLVETADAAARVDDLCRLPGVREIHFGLNDLRLSLGWPSHFHVLVSDYLAGLCDTVRDSGLRLGVGGIGRAGDNDLPVPSDLVTAQLPRLGASASLVSRSFFRAPMPADLGVEVGRARAWLDHCAAQPAAWQAQQRERLSACIARLLG